MSKHYAKALLGWRLPALLFVVVFLVSFSMGVSFTASAESNQVAEKRQELADLQKQLEEIQVKINGLGDTIADQQTKVNQLNKQVANMEAQIDGYETQIFLVDQEIAQQNKQIDSLNTEIADKEKELKAILEKLKKRVKAITKTGNYSSLQMLFDTNNYADYLLKTQVIKLVSDHDQLLREQAEAEKKSIEEKKALVEDTKKESEANKAELAAAKKELDKKYASLDSLYRQAYNAQTALKRKLGTYESEQAKIKKAEAEVDQEIQDLINGTPPASNYGGKMYWPVPAAKQISCTFGQKKDYFHGGTDIWSASINRKPIYAAADGVVVKAVAMHYSYGNYVLIDHGLDAQGRRIMTLYAHMATSPYVSVGQKVTGGRTQIGIVGSTGNSTGPHLHFEVRVNGIRVDPVGNGYIAIPR